MGQDSASENIPSRRGPSDAPGEYNLTKSLVKKLDSIAQELRQRLTECKKHYPGTFLTEMVNGAGQPVIVEVPEYYRADEYIRLQSACDAAIVLAEEIRRNQIAIFDGKVIRPAHFSTGGFYDMLNTPGKIETLHAFIRHELKDHHLAHTIRVLADYFRGTGHDGNYVPGDPARRFDWEEPRVLSLEERIKSLLARLQTLDMKRYTGEQLHEVRYSEQTRQLIHAAHALIRLCEGAEMKPDGDWNVPRTIPRRLDGNTHYHNVKSDIQALCTWIDQHYREADPGLSWAIKNLMEAVGRRIHPATGGPDR